MVKSYVVKTLTLPRDLVERIERRRASMQRLAGDEVKVSFSAAAVAALRDTLGRPARRRPDEGASTKGARSS